MTITLTPELERLVKEKIARGEYDSPDAFVSEAVQRLVDEEKEKTATGTRFLPESKLRKRRSTGATIGIRQANYPRACEGCSRARSEEARRLNGARPADEAPSWPECRRRLDEIWLTG